LEKAQFQTEDYLGEMGIDPDRVICCPLSTMVKDCLKDSGMDAKSILKCRNMFALGLVCYLFDRDLNIAFNYLKEKFAKKPGVAEANIAGNALIIFNLIESPAARLGINTR